LNFARTFLIVEFCKNVFEISYSRTRFDIQGTTKTMSHAPGEEHTSANSSPNGPHSLECGGSCPIEEREALLNMAAKKENNFKEKTEVTESEKNDQNGDGICDKNDKNGRFCHPESEERDSGNCVVDNDSEVERMSNCREPEEEERIESADLGGCVAGALVTDTVNAGVRGDSGEGELILLNNIRRKVVGMDYMDRC
jgi:hypothetical protein